MWKDFPFVDNLNSEENLPPHVFLFMRKQSLSAPLSACILQKSILRLFHFNVLNFSAFSLALVFFYKSADHAKTNFTSRCSNMANK